MDTPTAGQPLTGGQKLLLIVLALIVIGAVINMANGDDTSTSTNTGGGSSVCEENWRTRDPSFSSNNHDEFIRNCEAGKELGDAVRNCPSGTDGERCAAEALDKALRGK